MTLPDPRLQESLRLADDPNLVDPTFVPWTAIGCALVALLLGVLLILRRRRRPTSSAAVMPSEPPEDTLAALDAAWRRCTDTNLAETITAFAAILRRHLTRNLQHDCTTATSGELEAIFLAGTEYTERLRQLHATFFAVADEIRFAGGAANRATVGALYDVARHFVIAALETTATPSSIPPPPGNAGRSHASAFSVQPVRT